MELAGCAGIGRHCGHPWRPWSIGDGAERQVAKTETQRLVGSAANWAAGTSLLMYRQSPNALLGLGGMATAFLELVNSGDSKNPGMAADGSTSSWGRGNSSLVVVELEI